MLRAADAVWNTASRLFLKHRRMSVPSYLSSMWGPSRVACNLLADEGVSVLRAQDDYVMDDILIG